MRYIIVDANDIIINACDWDEKTEWSAPEGCLAIKEDRGDIGDTYKNGAVVPAPEPTPEPQRPSFEDLVLRASTFDELKTLVVANANK
jgi:hypothetical protein